MLKLILNKNKNSFPFLIVTLFQSIYSSRYYDNNGFFPRTNPIINENFGNYKRGRNYFINKPYKIRKNIYFHQCYSEIPSIKFYLAYINSHNSNKAFIGRSVLNIDVNELNEINVPEMQLYRNYYYNKITKKFYLPNNLPKNRTLRKYFGRNLDIYYENSIGEFIPHEEVFKYDSNIKCNKTSNLKQKKSKNDISKKGKPLNFNNYKDNKDKVYYDYINKKYLYFKKNSFLITNQYTHNNPLEDEEKSYVFSSDDLFSDNNDITESKPIVDGEKSDSNNSIKYIPQYNNKLQLKEDYNSLKKKLPKKSIHQSITNDPDKYYITRQPILNW